MSEKETRSMKGNLPSIYVSGKNLPETLEKAVIKVWEKGVDVRTHYDKKNSDGSYIDPPSREATFMIRVDNPFNEPRISKNIPGGPCELEKYKQEVVNGIHNHWIEPGSSKWTYTYNERLEEYVPSEDLNDPNARGILISRKKLWDFVNQGISLPKLLHGVHAKGKETIEIKELYRLASQNLSGEKLINAIVEGQLDVEPINQIEKVIQDLERDMTSKGAQAITWMPTADPILESNRPCLQRFWFRPLPTKINGEKGYLLNLNTHWRSRDLYKAWFMNSFAVTDWQNNIAQELEKRIGIPVRPGSYIDISDSLHLYGSYVDSNTEEGQRFAKEIEKMKTTSYKDRTYATEDWKEIMEEEAARLKKDPDYYKASKS